ncbi:MAG: hypothetical protein P4L98_11110 [Ancalomicrobiaceae bacterium]|nr:hypothetical protein [Ancalomicrobiaceae bacterium]
MIGSAGPVQIGETYPMPLSFDQMIVHSDLESIVRKLARAFVERYEADPRLAAVFATQQRWLLAHATMAIYFRGEMGEGVGLHSRAFLALVEAEKISARHTAHAFLKEMVNYGIAQYRSGMDKTKIRYINLSDAAVAAITFWMVLHLEILDLFDGGSRKMLFKRNPLSTAFLQPELANRLLSSTNMRVPKASFSLFTWLNNGGLVMDWLILGSQPTDAGAERVLTSITSIAEISERLKLSRTHLGRKLRDAEELGAIGWIGRRGKSTLWLSTEFRDDYYKYQLGKLAIIEAAFNAVAWRL